jgi:ribosome-associated toxin RatA of RatAB toxin-antitoxin module
MHTETRITIQGDVDRIFALASAVEDWPRWLPHYRWVHVLSGDRTDRVVEMAAHRDGFPVRWTARQRLEPTQHRIHFTHVRGISRGMEVTWFLEADSPLVYVRIVHDLTWGWPPIGPLLAHYIIGELFVSNIASKTLRTIKQHVEGHGTARSC